MKGSPQNAFGDDHMTAKAFKRKQVPVQENTAKRTAIPKVIKPVGGKLNDELSKNTANSRTATADELHQKLRLVQLSDNVVLKGGLSLSQHSLSNQNSVVGVKRSHALSANSVSESIKHGSSQARTAPRTESKTSEQDEDESDQLLESRESKLEALRICGHL